MVLSSLPFYLYVSNTKNSKKIIEIVGFGIKASLLTNQQGVIQSQVKFIFLCTLIIFYKTYQDKFTTKHPHYPQTGHISPHTCCIHTRPHPQPARTPPLTNPKTHRPQFQYFYNYPKNLRFRLPYHNCNDDSIFF